MNVVFIALAIIFLAVLFAVAAVKLWPRGRPLSAAERRELAAGPKPLLQKRALFGLLVILLTMAVTFAIVGSVGAQAYYDDDTIRLSVVAVFIAGMLAYALLVPVSLLGMRARGALDELDTKVLSQAPSYQSVAMLLTYAVWSIYLTEKFHDTAGIPPVYLFLVFGTLLLANLLAHAGGILTGYWFSQRHD